jgi:hypothetical protein
LLTLAGSLRLARLFNRQYSLYWPVNDLLGCRFECLFENHFPMVTGNDLHRILFTNNTVKVYNAWHDPDGALYNRVAADGDPDIDILILKCWSYPLRENDRNDDVLEAELRAHLATLAPMPAIRAEIECFPLPDNCFGVHIRRGDSPEVFARSTDECFLRVMSAVLEEDGNVRFFLATDAPEVEKLFRQRFGDRLLTFEKKGGGRATERGMQESLVDLLLLSKTRAIIGTVGSSFSRTAALWDGKPVIWAEEANANASLIANVKALVEMVRKNPGKHALNRPPATPAQRPGPR